MTMGVALDRDDVRVFGEAAARMTDSVVLYADAWAGLARVYNWRLDYGADGGIRVTW